MFRTARPSRARALLLSVGGLALAAPAAAQDFLVPADTVVIYDTAAGPLIVNSLTIEAGGELKIVGPEPFDLRARQRIVVHGELSANGFKAPDVATLNTGNIPEPGAAGVASGGRGGTSSWVTTNSTPFGLDGEAPTHLLLPPSAVGGRGGETGYGVGSKNMRRPGGGGGGALATGLPLQVGPFGYGMLPEKGEDGHPGSTGATSGTSPAPGGPTASSIFTDGDPRNDFWGVKYDASTGAILIGEALFPVGGFGGGAGGDASPTATFPIANWGPGSDEKGGPGGGGGGLLFLRTNEFVLGAAGRVELNGGGGAAGENTIGTDHLGGGGGGGSGGWLVVSARSFDLSQAQPFAIQALGGRGGRGQSGYDSVNAGGDGGPGVIQLHTRGGSTLPIQLPVGVTLDELTAPNAHVLMPLD